MRPLWSGAITFGLINIPVRLYSAIIEHGVNLDMLHKKDLSPIRFARVCKSEEKEVPYEDIVKGYEYEKGQYVVITEEDFAQIRPKKSKSISIECFIDESEIDPLYIEKPYYLEPDKGAGKTYLLLNEALKKTKKVGLVTYSIHTKAHIGFLKPLGRGIVLQQLRFHSELRNFAEIELPVAKLQSKEVEFAIKLVEQLSESFKPEKYKDSFKEDLQEIIDLKTKGKKGHKKKESEPTVTPSVDNIIDQLKASLGKSAPRARAAVRTRRVKK